MPFDLAIVDLLDYTDWERGKWLDWFRQRGGPALAISAGPHGDGRFQRVGELVDLALERPDGRLSRFSVQPGNGRRVQARAPD